MCLGAQKNRLIEMVYLNLHNIQVMDEKFQYALLSGGLNFIDINTNKCMSGDGINVLILLLTNQRSNVASLNALNY